MSLMSRGNDIMRLEHHLVGGYVRYVSPHIIILLLVSEERSQSFGRDLYETLTL